MGYKSIADYVTSGAVHPSSSSAASAGSGSPVLGLAQRSPDLSRESTAASSPRLFDSPVFSLEQSTDGVSNSNGVCQSHDGNTTPGRTTNSPSLFSRDLYTVPLQQFSTERITAPHSSSTTGGLLAVQPPSDFSPQTPSVATSSVDTSEYTGGLNQGFLGEDVDFQFTDLDLGDLDLSDMDSVISSSLSSPSAASLCVGEPSAVSPAGDNRTQLPNTVPSTVHVVAEALPPRSPFPQLLRSPSPALTPRQVPSSASTPRSKTDVKSRLDLVRQALARSTASSLRRRAPVAAAGDDRPASSCPPSPTNSVTGSQFGELDPVSPERLFLHWTNKESLCWLDCILSILAHSRPLRRAVYESTAKRGSLRTGLFALFFQTWERAQMSLPTDALSIRELIRLSRRLAMLMPTGGGSCEPVVTPPTAPPSAVVSEPGEQELLRSVMTPGSSRPAHQLPQLSSHPDQIIHSYFGDLVASSPSPPAVVSDGRQASEKAVFACSRHGRQLQHAMDQIDRIRERFWKFIQPRLKLSKGQDQSPVLIPPLLFHRDPVLCDTFQLHYEWRMTCSSCRFQKNHEFSWFIPTLVDLPPDFSMARPSTFLTCPRCSTSDQITYMYYKRLGTSVMMHFPHGVGSADLDRLDFAHDQHRYRVTALVQYRRHAGAKHFVAWIRHSADPGQWMVVDDLQGPLSHFKSGPPDVAADEVHIVVWEREQNGGEWPESVAPGSVRLPPGVSDSGGGAAPAVSKPGGATGERPLKSALNVRRSAGAAAHPLAVASRGLQMSASCPVLPGLRGASFLKGNSTPSGAPRSKQTRVEQQSKTQIFEGYMRSSARKVKATPPSTVSSAKVSPRKVQFATNDSSQPPMKRTRIDF